MSYSDYVICIPSYKRENICKNKTLTMLNHNAIDPSCIYVFVANDDEYEKYLSVLSPHTYNKLIVGVCGLIQQREFIENYFPENQNIVFIDDDVDTIDLSLSPMFQHNSLHEFLIQAFKITKSEDAFIWGIYPVFNPYFRKSRQEITPVLNYIVGAFYGIINRPKLQSLKLDITTQFNGQKEDVERTIKYFIQDGKVLRFNKIGFKTKYYGTIGGLGTFKNRLLPMLNASNKLYELYPQYGKVTTRKNGMTEFKLNRLKSPPPYF